MRAEGIRGESLAEGYLKSKGYKIIGRNEKLMGIEVDLIATAPDGDVCFIEVKSRTTYSYGYALEAVTPAKIARYKRFINLYTQIHRLYDKTLRIDVIAISGDDVEHIENVGEKNKKKVI